MGNCVMANKTVVMDGNGNAITVAWREAEQDGATASRAQMPIRCGAYQYTSPHSPAGY